MTLQVRPRQAAPELRGLSDTSVAKENAQRTTFRSERGLRAETRTILEKPIETKIGRLFLCLNFSRVSEAGNEMFLVT